MNRKLKVGDVVVLPLGGPKHGMIFTGPYQGVRQTANVVRPFYHGDQWSNLSEARDSVTRDSTEHEWTVLLVGNTCPTPATPHAKFPNSVMLCRNPVSVDERTVILFVAAEECFRLEDKALRAKTKE